MKWKLVKNDLGISVYLSYEGLTTLILPDTFMGSFKTYRNAVSFIRECKKAGIRQEHEVLVPVINLEE